MVAARLHTNEACYLDNAAALHLRRSRIEISSWEVDDDDDAPHSHGMMQISPAAAAADSSHYVISPQADYYSPSSHHDNSPSLVVEGEAIDDHCYHHFPLLDDSF
jgi:hypothetical protein